jgi:DNA topoisomerase-1
MQSAELDQTTVEIADETGRTRMRANGSVIAFDGFLKLYREDEDDRAADARAGIVAPGAAPARPGEDERTLPPSATRTAEDRRRRRQPAFTQPPPRFSEATLVKKLRGARHRPALHLCLDPAGAAGPRICPPRQAPLPAGGPRPLGDRLPGRLLREIRRHRFTAELEGKLDDISGAAPTGAR